MASFTSPLPFVVLRLAGQFRVQLQWTTGYVVRVWEHPDGSYIARVGFRLRTPAGLIEFDATERSLEAALELAIVRVDQAIRDSGDLDVQLAMEDIPTESY